MRKQIIKRAFSALIGASIIASSLAPALAAPTSFTDINAEQYAWAEPFIIDMAKKGYITGYDDDTFRPDNEVTRLECLALFARAMGSNNEVNEPILEIAHEMYDSEIRSYSLPWGSDEIVYMMYKGALKRSDLDTYLSGVEKNKPMRRCEAAIIITKAMGGESEALSDLGVALSYSDASEIPSNAIQYVQYATDKGIMKGMEDNMFSPETSVLRSQMAVMLSRAVTQTSYSFTQARITAVDTTQREVTVRGSQGQTNIYVYNDATEMRNLGESISPRDMTIGVQAIITLSGDKLMGVDTISREPDEVITGQYKSMATANGIIKVRVQATGAAASKQYECTPDVSIMFDGSPATMRSFKDGDYVTMEMVSGKVASIKGETKTTTVSGAKVENLDIGITASMTISHVREEYNGKTYEISDNVIVTKNSESSDLRRIYTGDTVTLTLEYGIITKISAVAKSGVSEGTIQAITISANPNITVKINGNDEVFDITPDVEIIIDDKEAALSDFSVGDTVKISTESNAVKRIVASSVKDLMGTVTGVVTGVNTSYKVITVRKDTGESMQFQCPENGRMTTTYITTNGNIKKLSDIAAEQSVEVKYSVSNGVYIATLVIILSE